METIETRIQKSLKTNAFCKNIKSALDKDILISDMKINTNNAIITFTNNHYKYEYNISLKCTITEIDIANEINYIFSHYQWFVDTIKSRLNVEIEFYNMRINT